MFVPPAGYTPTEEDVAPLHVDDNNGIVTFTDKFPYLGTVINSALTDDDDVRHRKQCAAAAFGQLKQNMFCSEYASESLSRAQKGKLFKTFVLGTLLFGCELWCLTTSLRQELSKFYNNCVRSMCNVTRRYIAHTTHGKLDSLYDALGIQSLDYYLLNRRLRWAGHVARMPQVRIPRRLLTSWVDHPRVGHGASRLSPMGTAWPMTSTSQAS